MRLVRLLSSLLLGSLVALAAVADPPVKVPFELVDHHILLPVMVNGGGPYWFIFDTGDRFGIVDIDLARRLGMKIGQEVVVRGVAGETKGAFVDEGTYALEALPNLPQPVKLAFSLAHFETHFGHPIAGILGSDFIRLFVVEVDYEAKVLRLHDAQSFRYQGAGESLPVSIDHSGHPHIPATITPTGQAPISGEFVLDLGASGSVAIHPPVASANHLPDANADWLRVVGAGGVGGGVKGKLAKLESVTIGHMTIKKPIALVEEGEVDPHAGNSIGRIEQRVARNFRIFLDYQHDRIIFEPRPDATMTSDYLVSGLAVEAVGEQLNRFRVTDVSERSPAAGAGFRAGDMILAVDGRPAANWTLTTLHDMLETAGAHTFVIARNGAEMKLSLTSRRLT